MDDDAIQDPTPFPAPGRLGAGLAPAPETTGAWLHVVSGPTVPALSRAVFELAARFIARGDRVLLLDGAPRLRLHERFDREARWGVLDSLSGGLPVLGLVQDAGRLTLPAGARHVRGPRLARLPAVLEAAPLDAPVRARPDAPAITVRRWRESTGGLVAARIARPAHRRDRRSTGHPVFRPDWTDAHLARSARRAVWSLAACRCRARWSPRESLLRRCGVGTSDGSTARRRAGGARGRRRSPRAPALPALDAPQRI